MAPNKFGRGALFVMQKGKTRVAGPMSMQPVDHGSTMPAPLLPAMPSEIGIDHRKTSMPKTQKTRTDAVRAAKARIMRRNSLRKQRLAQKGLF
jgi:hypothetical protein